ncbi:hypothetical protein EDD95_1250 [Streptomyces sp. CEV 2-1]|uniref:hypothetical protein n=1 Tax=Streptomyces sp. CEV 2-1 TaxID=2485153 RepID=UPI000F9E3726|nr:hypothetical protein [Streptomyces sp. CEV 2-1]ROQ81661.1 hypothetical protein EDD95_1250 [Streptomyces sp. CEV 2-1]
MNDDATTPAPLPEPGPGPVPDSAPVPGPAPARRGRARRVILATVPVVLVLAAVAGAAAYTKATVDGADRTVTTRLWARSAHGPGKDPAGDVSRGRASTELSKLLLPVPDGYRLGPDHGAHGNDSELSSREATAEMKAGSRGLAGKQRRELEKRIDKLHVQGLAIRTYASDGNDLIVRTELVRMKDEKAVRDLYVFRTGLFDAAGLLRDGPAVGGHKKNAKCFLQPEDSELKIESMFCMAYDGETVLTFSASGPTPVDTSSVAGLVKDQLDHITSPGEYV